MAGRMGDAAMIGLPGNPVSAMVCGTVFVAPLIRKMLGLGTAPASLLAAPLGADLPENGPRAHYMRATFQHGHLFAANSQDSSLLTVLSTADALLVRPVDDPPRKTGEMVSYLPI